ncbi:hypothetical protein [Shinella zoogloeoides]|uniref:hypothetical protein n=1 Tax=Shinella zoogloeoides TaxID=352475 RepID=UPI00273E4952|nr:hypothetical protein [Shinella zoogloeoides]WLR92913.1 hypothetical protein Q9316_01515 [Shinella zoogloeoides]
MAKEYLHSREAVEHLYRRIADNAPREELLEIVHDRWGQTYNLRPPVSEIQLARNCGTERRTDG